MENASNTIIEDIDFFKSVSKNEFDPFKHKATQKKVLGIKNGDKVAYVLFVECDGNIMTTKLGLHLVNTKLGLKSVLHISELKGGVMPKSTQLFDADTYLKIANAAANHGYLYSLYSDDGTKINVGVIVVLMMSFPGYSLHYASYFGDPDDNVETIQNERLSGEETSANVWAGKIGMQRTADPHPVNKLKAMAYLMCFFMTKTTTVAGQFETVVTKRLETFAAASGYEDIVGKAPEIIEVMPEPMMNKLNKSIHFYPKLKSNIFTFLLYSSGPEFEHMSEIFKESQLTIFNIVYQFLVAEQVTKLHVNPKVLAERITWMEIFTRIYNKYGQSWPYYKLYEPRSLDTAVSKYPVFASAALSFAAVNESTNTVQLSRLAGRVKAIDTFKKLARLHALPGLIKGGNYMSARELISSLSEHALVPIRFDEALLTDDVAWKEVEAESGMILN